MARTKRNIPMLKRWGKDCPKCYRYPKTFGIIKREAIACQMLEEEGFGQGRCTVRANPNSGALPSAWDDLRVAAGFEVYGATTNL